MEKENVLITGKIGPSLLKFAIPFLAASLLQALYGAADLFFVGQYSDSSAVSAVAIGSQVMQTITGIILGISTGATVIIGRHIGEKDFGGAAKTIGTTAVLFIILSIIITPIMVLLTGRIVSVMDTPPEAAIPARNYILTCSLGIPFIVGYNAVSGIFRGIGDSKTPVYFILLACIINIVMDYILTAIIPLSAEGAAIATVMAQGISFIASLLYLKKKGLGFKFTRSHISFNKGLSLMILKVGAPLALQDALVNVSFLVITAIVNSLGIVASASVGVVEKIVVFAMLPPTAFASAVAAMTAQNVGAGKTDRARKVLWYGVSYSLIFGVIACLLGQFTPQSLTSLFSNDPQVIASAAQYLKSYSLDCLFVSFVFCMNSYFSGFGKSIIAFAHSMVATFIIRIPLTYILSKAAGGSLYIIGFAAPCATAVSLIICLYFINAKKDMFLLK